MKKHNKRILIILAVLLLAIIVGIATVVVMNNAKAKQVEEYIDGKILLDSDRLYKDYIAYSFRDGKIAKEEGKSYLHNNDKDGSVEGSIDEFFQEYKVSASVFSNEILISVKEEHGWVKMVAFYFNEGNIEKYRPTDTRPELKIVSKEELDEFRNNCVCKHSFTNWRILNVATVDTYGNKERNCSKCGKLESFEFNYSNQIKPTVSELEERLFNTYSVGNWDFIEDNEKKVYSKGKNKCLIVPKENSKSALIFKYEWLDGGNKMVLYTSETDNGKISWVYAECNFESNGVIIFENLIPNIFGEDCEAIDVKTLNQFVEKSSCTSESGWNIYKYEYGGIKYELKENSTGFYFKINF